MVKRFIYRVICGFFLGISVFAPGFSGSLIAIVLGIYQDILRVFSNPFKPLGRNIKFALPLGLGVVASAVLFIFSFKYLFESYEKATFLLFVGLIAGNLPLVFASIRKIGFKPHYLIGLVAAFAAALTLGLLAGVSNSASVGVLTANPALLALGGLAAGATALIPGMSVTVVLLLMGVYGQLIFAAESLMHMDFNYLLPFGVFVLCAIVALVVCSRGIKAVFDKFPGFANATVFGFMSGSLIGILVECLQMPNDNFTWLFGSLMLIAGLAISMLFVVLGKFMKKEA
ncbi:MAG: DUF368 domain-containing protein [Oscillospiraceae bacterium]|nr:DUF368 domain-containing protein [Oscillospiraceae bacterium]